MYLYLDFLFFYTFGSNTFLLVLNYTFLSNDMLFTFGSNTFLCVRN